MENGATYGRTTRLVDSGASPEIFVSGLARIDTMGSVSRLVWYVQRSVVDGAQIAALDECPVSLILPTAALVQLVELVLLSFGAPAAKGSLMLM